MLKQGKRAWSTGRSVRAVPMLLVLLVCGVGCSRASEGPSSSWPTLEVPAATRVVDLPPVAATDRVDRISLERELVYATSDGWLTGGADTLHVAVSDERLLVLSGLRGQIAVFAATGERQGVWAAKGTGQGELFGPAGFAVHEDRIFVVDVAASRLSVWSTSGEYLDEVSRDEYRQINGVTGVSEHGLVLSKVLLTQDDEEQALSLFSFEGDERERYAILPTDQNAEEETVWPRPLVAMGAAGTVYATTASEYQVNMYEPDGTVGWVVRVDWPRARVSEAARRTVERTQRAGRALGANVRDREQLPSIPELFPALDGLEVDGHGRVYVFPLVEGGADRHPVDVYDSAGQRLAAGWLPFRNWEAQSGDHVYRIESDPETGATAIVRYRLALTLE